MSFGSPKNGEFIECTDPAIREYLIFLNSKEPAEHKFIITDIDDRYLFIKAGVSDKLKEKINLLVTSNTFSEEDRDSKKKKQRVI
ncbi:transcription factor IIH, putative [Trichomonas vaginalis G3]|uniref:General transcription and DNA repair factor IIH subunit TFB5 n=1 Tax=Trichomonas vaginalis (strain ATCC PRA-98 / G3) TaxID=412133 RepID=A2D7B4_TRIV3|nr:TFIIH subunit TTDA/Tfb5 family [Trichomonas vaginalis G3]EAY23631.1 transcription factor IIH, putative [Trichomonas vaginalis G3]KAI5490123.1 TFIIH subunit TTDA/Tfb5 family [Trichomonas vaginalis G3]|eukprot:XP_001276879.1 transcription factor IIH [Trichomonas vaginalis G3]